MHGRILAALIVVIAWAFPVRAVEPDKYVPADTAIVVGMDLRQVAHTSLFTKYLREPAQRLLKQDEPLPRLLASAGIDPLQDVERLTWALPQQLFTEPSTLIVRGRFDAAGVLRKLKDTKSPDGPIIKILRSEMGAAVELQMPNDADRWFAGLPESGVLIVSRNRETVLAAPAPAKSESARNKLGKLALLLRGIDGKKSVWLAAVLPDDLRREMAANEFLKASADKSAGLRGGVEVNDALVINLKFLADDAKTSGDIRRFLEGARAIVVLALTSNEPYAATYGPGLAELLNALKIEGGKGGVAVTGMIGAARIEQALKKNGKKP